MKHAHWQRHGNETRSVKWEISGESLQWMKEEGHGRPSLKLKKIKVCNSTPLHPVPLTVVCILPSFGTCCVFAAFFTVWLNSVYNRQRQSRPDLWQLSKWPPVNFESGRFINNPPTCSICDGLLVLDLSHGFSIFVHVFFHSSLIAGTLRADMRTHAYTCVHMRTHAIICARITACTLPDIAVMRCYAFSGMRIVYSYFNGEQ